MTLECKTLPVGLVEGAALTCCKVLLGVTYLRGTAAMAGWVGSEPMERRECCMLAAAGLSGLMSMGRPDRSGLDLLMLGLTENVVFL